MMRRMFDVVVAAGALVIVAPVLACAFVGIRGSSPGPVFYRAQRVGKGGRLFTMFKLRTMHCRPVAGSSITAANDSRVFPVGRLLRALKVDELPQLWNIIRGDMAIVGPRPEAPDIVERHYTAEYRESLDVRPGLTSPGSICYYESGEQLLAEGQAEDFYVSHLLPVKMAADLEAIRNPSFVSDLRVIARTAFVLLRKALGRSSRSELAAKPDSATAITPESIPARRAA